MRVMQMAADDVIHVIAVRNRRVTTCGGVDMVGRLFRGTVSGRALLRIRGGDFQDMLVHVTGMDMVQMPAIQIVHVAGMLHGEMAAAGTMLMLVGLGMFMVGGTAAGD